MKNIILRYLGDNVWKASLQGESDWIQFPAYGETDARQSARYYLRIRPSEPARFKGRDDTPLSRSGVQPHEWADMEQ